MSYLYNTVTAATGCALILQMADLWSDWLPEDCLNTIRQGGYYTTLLRPGHRIVSINTQIGDILNFFVVCTPLSQITLSDGGQLHRHWQPI